MNKIVFFPKKPSKVEGVIAGDIEKLAEGVQKVSGEKPENSEIRVKKPYQVFWKKNKQEG